METTAKQSISAEIRPLLVISALLLVLTTVIYPLAVTGIGQGLFGSKANGSMLEVGGETVGSKLVGQSFTEAAYFHGRPSAAGAGYDAASSSGSNLGPTSAKLIQGVADDPTTADVDESFAGLEQRAAAFRAENGLDADTTLPADAITASASGLDPHVSPATAQLQIARVAGARGVDAAAIRELVDDHTEARLLGIFGQPRVNVLELNVALDEQFPVR